jgi:hypothetical protein
MKIVIIAPATDRESEIVRWGLRQLGCEPVLWDWRAPWAIDGN